MNCPSGFKLTGGVRVDQAFIGEDFEYR
jgi:hypothetical protein